MTSRPKSHCSLFNQAPDVADARALLAEAAQIPIRPQVTRYPLAEANRALQDLKADRINGTGVLLVGDA